MAERAPGSPSIKAPQRTGVRLPSYSRQHSREWSSRSSPAEHSARLIGLGYMMDLAGRLRLTGPGRWRIAGFENKAGTVCAAGNYGIVCCSPGTYFPTGLSVPLTLGPFFLGISVTRPSATRAAITRGYLNLEPLAWTYLQRQFL